MKIRTLFLLLLLLTCRPLAAQIRLEGDRQADINPDLIAGSWSAYWISVPGEPLDDFGVYHMRKTFELESVPERYIVHATADNRYKLYVNGRFVSLGPARGDIYNWSYETIDLAPYLKPGRNVLAAVVWNFADWKPEAQVTFHRTGFLLQGNTAAEAAVNTNNSWLCCKNESYAPHTKSIRGVFYAAGPCERFDASKYPWGWEQPDYDDSGWKKAWSNDWATGKDHRRSSGRRLVPRPIPPMEMKPERFKRIRSAEGIEVPADFTAGKAPLTIPARSRVTLLLDNDSLTTGYLHLDFAGGKDAEVTIAYAEALFEDPEKGLAKGNRNETDGKHFLGYEDKIIADGGADRTFTPLWWRTWRFVQLTVETKSEPLVLEDISGTFSAYPFRRETRFEAPGHEELNRMLDIGWRTARLCANETYMDCPYYEQLQYFGDTRIQMLVSLYNTRDDKMVRNAIEQGRQSIVAEGLTQSRYPSDPYQLIPSFSLWWICMGHDYWTYRGEDAWLRSLLPAHRGILSWYEALLKPDYSLASVPYWFFADWAAEFYGGDPIREKEGNSAFQDLIYLLTLDASIQMEEAFGSRTQAEHYADIAGKIRGTIRAKYWDAERGLFADTYDHRSFSQHVNAMAILADIVTGDEAREVMTRTLEDKSLIQTTIYFRYYLHRALAHAGLGDLLLDNLQIWRDQMALGLTTWAETPEPTRSDCHAWGSSPNIELFRVLLGIDSDAPGFGKIRIAPSLCGLKQVSGSIPHPAGTVSADYKVDKRGRLTARLTLPEGTTGRFIWQGEQYELHAGEQVLKL